MKLFNITINNAFGFFIGITTLLGGIIAFVKILYVLYLVWKGEREYDNSSFIVVTIITTVLVLVGYAILRVSITKRTVNKTSNN